MASTSIHSFRVLFARLSWMIFGPLALFLLLSAIVRIGQGWMTGADVVYLGVLTLMIVARTIEFRSGVARTATGEPMTSAHLIRYAIGVVVIGGAAYVVANLLANNITPPIVDQG